ncbi:hypothetical protein C3L33_21060, partial [Rhododendron williamsianum]
MSIIVFSKNFLNSTACLFEIRTIIEHRKKKSDHLILPVFYEVEVDPWEIKEQAKNLDSGEKKLRADKVKGWGAALEEVLSIVGRKLENENVLKNISTKSGSSLTLSMNTIQEIKDMAAMASRMRRVGDPTVHLPAILFGTHAEKILACEANQLIAATKR